MGLFVLLNVENLGLSNAEKQMSSRLGAMQLSPLFTAAFARALQRTALEHGDVALLNQSKRLFKAAKIAKTKANSAQLFLPF